MIDNVKRDKPKEKVKDFFSRSIDLIYAVEHQELLSKTKKLGCGLGRVIYLLISSNSNKPLTLLDRRLLVGLTCVFTVIVNIIVIQNY